MDEPIFIFVFYLVLAMGFISLVWLRRGFISISDRILRKLFAYLFFLALVCFIYAGWKFMLVQNIDSNSLANTPIDAIFITVFFAVISGVALCSKQIGDMYGFKVRGVKNEEKGR